MSYIINIINNNLSQIKRLTYSNKMYSSVLTTMLMMMMIMPYYCTSTYIERADLSNFTCTPTQPNSRNGAGASPQRSGFH